MLNFILMVQYLRKFKNEELNNNKSPEKPLLQILIQSGPCMFNFMVLSLLLTKVQKNLLKKKKFPFIDFRPLRTLHV